ncbi:MAG: type I-C CRISPR-associated protein Cas5c, partial [Dehalococcoidia bacterium]
MGGPLLVKLWGELACFTRPELKVERVSYPVMTPSAARGALEAIFWRPAFSWRIREIRVLRPPRFVSLVRNEVTHKASVAAMAGRPFYADEHRAQRHTLALRDVAYVIAADIVPKPLAGARDPSGFRDQFRRRVRRGQCFQTPYLGCREF